MRAIIVVVLATGCTEWHARAACDPEWDSAAFVLQCVKAANPMSDEEPEDMIAGCTRAARHACPVVPGVVNMHDWVHAPCSKAWLPEQRAVCGGGR